MESNKSFIVVKKNQNGKGRSDGISWVGKKFVAEIPEECSQGIEGNNRGAYLVETSFVGLPSKKFNERNKEYLAEKNKSWMVQSLHKIADKKFFVMHEGWAAMMADVKSEEEVEQRASQAYEWATVRHAFQKQVLNLSEAEMMKKNIEFMKYPRHMFWSFDDLSYYHSKLNQKFGQPPVFYIHRPKTTVKPPKYTYSPICVVTEKVFAKCMVLDEKLNSLATQQKRNSDPQNACTNRRGCVCDTLFKGYFEERGYTYLKQRGDSTITTEYEASRIVIECSDLCGCSDSCPRRVVQNGKAAITAVYRENSEKGFGLWAMKDLKAGQFVTEYTGEMYYFDESIHNKDTSYEMDVTIVDNLTICSWKLGNHARFINHSCDPNVAFIEVLSKKLKTDIFVPRIGLFTVKDVAAGEELTAKYWEINKNHTASDVPCRCNAENCMKFLPK